MATSKALKDARAASDARGVPQPEVEPFTREPSCGVCGADARQIARQYHHTGASAAEEGNICLGLHGEHLHLICRQCGYQSLMAPPARATRPA